MISPKITYDAGAGLVTLTPTWPPTGKPGADELDAIRHDSITTSGVKQSITERTDIFLNINFTFVPAADIAAWVAFMTWAIPGGKFTYYPDITNLGVHQDYTLEDTNWIPKRVAFGHYSFQLHCRQWVP